MVMALVATISFLIILRCLLFSQKDCWSQKTYLQKLFKVPNNLKPFWILNCGVAGSEQVPLARGLLNLFPNNFFVSKENSTYEEKLNTALHHMGTFVAANSSLVRTMEDMKQNVADMMSSTWLNSSVVQALNHTIYEKINAN